MDKKELVNFVVSELFAPDGILKLSFDVHLQPYQKAQVRNWVRSRVNEETDIEFSEEETKHISQKEYAEELINFIKDHG